METYLNLIRGMQAAAVLPTAVGLMFFLPSKSSKKKEKGAIALMISSVFIAGIQTLSTITLIVGDCFGMKMQGLVPYLCTGIPVIWTALKLFLAALNMYMKV